MLVFSALALLALQGGAALLYMLFTRTEEILSEDTFKWPNFTGRSECWKSGPFEICYRQNCKSPVKLVEMFPQKHVPIAREGEREGGRKELQANLIFDRKCFHVSKEIFFLSNCLYLRNLHAFFTRHPEWRPKQILKTAKFQVGWKISWISPNNCSQLKQRAKLRSRIKLLQTSHIFDEGHLLYNPPSSFQVQIVKPCLTLLPLHCHGGKTH